MKKALLSALFGACLMLLAPASGFADDDIPNVVPEPTSMTLLAVGSAGMFFLNRRRK